MQTDVFVPQEHLRMCLAVVKTVCELESESQPGVW